MNGSRFSLEWAIELRLKFPETSLCANQDNADTLTQESANRHTSFVALSNMNMTISSSRDAPAVLLLLT